MTRSVWLFLYLQKDIPSPYQTLCSDRSNRNRRFQIDFQPCRILLTFHKSQSQEHIKGTLWSFFLYKQKFVYSHCLSPNKLWVYPWGLTNMMNLPTKLIYSENLFTYKMGAQSKTPQGTFKFNLSIARSAVGKKRLLWQYNYSILMKTTWKWRDKETKIIFDGCLSIFLSKLLCGPLAPCQLNSTYC